MAEGLAASAAVSKARPHTIATGRGLRGRQILQQYLDQIGQSHDQLVDLRQKRMSDSAGAAVLALGAVAITILGWLDDKHELKALPKFIGQILIAVAVAAA